MAVNSIVQYSQLTSDIRIDAEYYKPNYLEQEQKIAALRSKMLYDLAIVSDGNHVTIKDQFNTSGVRYLRGQDLKDFFVSDDNPVYIPNKAYEKLKRSHMKPEDVLLSIVGTIGSVSIVTDKYKALTGNCKIAIIRSRSINPYFLAAYFASKIGQDQISRRIRGAVQQGLILPDLKTFPIPDVDDKKAKEIEELVKESFYKQKEAESLYTEAEALLLRELGLDSLDLSPQIAHTANFSEAMEARRLDAEYFQPKFWKIINTIQNKVQWCRLNDIVTYCQRGIQPKYVEVGTINVVNTKHMTSTILSDDLEKTDEEFWINNKNARLQKNDVLLYSTGAYIGRTNFYPSYEKAIGSNHVTIIRVDPKKCNPLYVSLYLNTTPGLFQTDQRARGSAQREIYPDDIRTFVIGLPKREIQDQIGGKVRQSFETRQMAKTLLEDAKNRVEQMILGEK